MKTFKLKEGKTLPNNLQSELHLLDETTRTSYNIENGLKVDDIEETIGNGYYRDQNDIIYPKLFIEENYYCLQYNDEKQSPSNR